MKPTLETLFLLMILFFSPFLIGTTQIPQNIIIQPPVNKNSIVSVEPMSLDII